MARDKTSKSGKLLIVTGLSGAGKSIAMHALEDLGLYCVDNLPLNLLPALAVEFEADRLGSVDRAAVGIDARSPPETLANFPAVLSTLSGRDILGELFFFEASEDVLISRYSETRRKHPLSTQDVSLAEAIRQEKALLAPVRRVADVHIDTSNLHIHQLRELMRHRVDQRESNRLSLMFESFGFKFGPPGDADFVFDVRCLPNPHWEPSLRGLTGRDQEVADYLDAQPLVGSMLGDIRTALEKWIPQFESVDRAYLTIAIGCTGGQHRSVFIAERLAEHFTATRGAVLTRHRELAKLPTHVGAD
ncbi:MAG: RNase adapter RapZ [Gammaproteobacteria bacterium]|nr:RNase adapter RapZ [Gammaproteobacteria bacterium]